MADVEEIKRLLAEEYGIHSSCELDRAFRNIEKLNIGVCAAPVRKESGLNEKTRCIA